MGTMIHRRRGRKVACSSCERPLRGDAKLCSCGQPTQNMTFDERRRYEVERWRAMRAQVSA
ncbi:MAG TPA: hypothetical protein VGB52_02370 [Actinomycetota bacterium]